MNIRNIIYIFALGILFMFGHSAPVNAQAVPRVLYVGQAVPRAPYSYNYPYSNYYYYPYQPYQSPNYDPYYNYNPYSSSVSAYGTTYPTSTGSNAISVGQLYDIKYVTVGGSQPVVFGQPYYLNTSTQAGVGFYSATFGVSYDTGNSGYRSY